MQVRIPDAEVGVIIGRFQVSSLHDGHKGLIDHVRSHHKKVLVLIGSTPGIRATRRQPLDYHTRMLMVQEEYPDVIVAPVSDMPSDEDWSVAVDQRIFDTFGGGSAALYGSRDGFIPYYSGSHQTVELAASIEISGSKVRKDVSDEVRSHEEFRRGVIYASFARFPTMYATVDIAVVRQTDKRAAWEVVLGRKRNDPPGTFRFPGGFADPVKDHSFLDTAKREVEEELPGGIYKDFKCIGSSIIEDWRYRSESDSIMTTVFVATYEGGEISAGDDLHEMEWVPVADKDLTKRLLPQHHPILAMLKNHLNISF